MFAAVQQWLSCSLGACCFQVPVYGVSNRGSALCGGGVMLISRLGGQSSVSIWSCSSPLLDLALA
jgi:hypothetical protein